MSWRVGEKAFLTKPGDLSSMAQTHIVGIENQLPQPVPTCVLNKHTYTLNKQNVRECSQCVGTLGPPFKIPDFMRGKKKDQLKMPGDLAEISSLSPRAAFLPWAAEGGKDAQM